MKIRRASIRNFGSLKDVSFEGANFLVFIGPNSSGKSLIFEALMKFFNEFNPIGGTSAVTDLLWFKRDTSSPIEFEITLELSEEEIKELVPFGDKIISAVKGKFADTFNIIKIKRSLQSNGAWKTNEIKWSEIELVLDDALASPEKIQNFIQPLLSLSDYKMYFFTQGYSKDNIGGDRLLVNLTEKKGLTSNPIIDDLVKKGLIEFSTEYQGRNWQEWAKENNIAITSPGVTDIAELGVITPEILQRFITQLTKLRTVFKLIPAARDMKSSPGLRSSFLDPNLLQGVTSTSIDTSSKAFMKWNEYRGYIKKILGRELEPNPTQVRIIDSNVGLFPAYIGGGDQSVLGLIWETMEANSIIGIEEPENHLHPRLQRLLLEYLQELSAKTQVIICTHSAIFASKPDISNVLLVSKDAEGATQIEPVNQTNVYRIIDELGVKPSDILDFDTIVFVEGKCDVKIFDGFKLTLLKSEDNIGFVDAGGWTSMEYFANAKILGSLKPPRRIFVVFDGDTERNKKIKERLLNELNVKDENIITLKETQIEAYLLVPSAIKRAFPNLNLSESEILGIIEAEKDKKNKKILLDLILRKGNLGPYDDEKAGSIAKSFLENEINNEIKAIFTKISGK
ncbi:MAG: AAA family ATPase [Candidatus Jordarchaeaceae archaeon]